MPKKKHKSVSEKVKRLSFPEDEKKHSWLRLLLEGYYIVDKGVAKALDAEQKKGRIPACAKGCAHCCSTHQDIPIYPLEIAGVSWYAAEKLSGPEREALKTQLARYRTNDTCPFLVDAACAIHPMRPMACRQFNVFGSPCKEGEDPYYSRRQDVMEPVKKHVDQAFFIMLPFYGVEKESERIKIVETGSFHQMVKELHVCNWKELAERMARRDRNNR
ncbi:MAG TPA: YkgJ family cysteine cluster protein [Nitrospiraceae bacterium]|nr:YkgJ family cysteine cluster protein [Nitrospiraceae bacterium]